MTLTWAATIRQPSGKRAQVCICRPTLPGALAVKQRRGDRVVAAIGGDHGRRVLRVSPTGERAARNAVDRVIAVEVFADAVAERARVVRGTARRARRRRSSPAPSRSARTRASPRRRTSGRSISILSILFGGRGAARDAGAAPAHGRRASAMSSRQGAAMICTPIGSGSSGTGTATTGRPMNEIGWV